MNNKSYIVSVFFVSLIVLLSTLFFYLREYHSLSNKDEILKKSYVKLSTLPDLSLANDTSYIRHRTLTSLFSIYSNDANLPEDKLLTYTISDAKIMK
ncbi:hypothetical protein [Sulfurimonas sp.]